MEGRGGGVSLETAIRDKYCCNEGEGRAGDSGKIREFAVFMSPGGHPVGQRSSVVLDGQGVSHVESREGLADLCPSLQELHLGGNSLSLWSDLYAVLLAFPQLRFLDLSQNPVIPSPSPPPPSPLSPSLQVLVLNSTALPWSGLQPCLTALPSLQELHLANNGYTGVNFDPTFSHHSLHRLYINNNLINRWAELEKLGHAFPTLHTLIAIGNPLSDSEEEGEEEEEEKWEEEEGMGAVFSCLSCLSLNSTQLSHWKTVDLLASLPQLTELSLLEVPLTVDMDIKEGRFSIIARLPGLLKLNKSPISEVEREQAERWAIRTYRGKGAGERPASYQRLVETHGEVPSLAEVDMTPHHQAELEFHLEFPERERTERHFVDLYQSTTQLKQWVSRWLDMPLSKLRVFYVDLDLLGSCSCTEELRSNKRQLFSYNMKDGDRIHVQILS